MSIQSPELLLPRLNRALRELRGAAYMLEDEELDAELVLAMRRLLAAEVVGKDYRIIAVGGSQGVGKTTLIRSIYDLAPEKQDGRDWLPANEGRGETLPILIQEDGNCEKPRGFLRKLTREKHGGSDFFSIQDDEVDDDEFRKAAKGGLDEVMLPILKVPRRIFKSHGQALMLLPGYEPTDKKNESWQELMRQVMVGAAGCIIVTNETRLADQEQRLILDDMLSNELRTINPLVVVSNTESNTNQDDLRKRAAEVFGIANHRQVVCSGAGNSEYFSRWFPDFKAALGDISIGGGGTSAMQTYRVRALLERDLGNVVLKIKSNASIVSHADEGGNATRLKEILEIFDDAAERLKRKHSKAVQEILAKKFEPASKKLKETLAAKHEGVWNKIKYSLDSISEDQLRLTGDVSDVWRESGEIGSEYVKALGRLAEIKPVEADKEAPILQRLGYPNIDSEKETLVSNANLPVLMRPAVQSNLIALLGSSSDSEVSPPKSNNEWEKTIKLIPSMALEYVRLAGAMPELVGVHPVKLENMPQVDLAESFQRVSGQFEQFHGTSVTLLKSLALMLAVDGAADGKIDTIPALLTALGMGSSTAGAAGGVATGAATASTTASTGGTTTATTAGGAAAGTAVTVAAAVAGVIAIGFLTRAALQEVRQHDSAVSALAHSMLMSIRDHHQQHFDEHFDNLMDMVRSRLVESLRHRYGLDMRLMKQDRLGKSLADVDRLRYEFLEALAASGRGLQ